MANKTNEYAIIFPKKIDEKDLEERLDNIFELGVYVRAWDRDDIPDMLNSHTEPYNVPESLEIFHELSISIKWMKKKLLGL
ncbi:MAG: hypothetical protein ACLFR1_12070 [Spirochaetia bacterium]